MASSQDERDPYRLIRQVGILTAIPMIMVAGPLVGFFLGRFLDERLHSAPWGLVGGLLLGVVAAARETIRMIRRAIQDTDDRS